MNNIGYSRYDEPKNADWRNELGLPSEDVQDMKMKMKNILATVYGDNEIEDLEFELEQLAAYFGMKLPAMPFKLKRT